MRRNSELQPTDYNAKSSDRKADKMIKARATYLQFVSNSSMNSGKKSQEIDNSI